MQDALHSVWRRLDDYVTGFDERAGEGARLRDDSPGDGGSAAAVCLLALVAALACVIASTAAGAPAPF